MKYISERKVINSLPQSTLSLKRFDATFFISPTVLLMFTNSSLNLMIKLDKPLLVQDENLVKINKKLNFEEEETKDSEGIEIDLQENEQDNEKPIHVL